LSFLLNLNFLSEPKTWFLNDLSNIQTPESLHGYPIRHDV